MNNNIWIHVGFPKCASTSLQMDFFASLQEINYIGRHDDCNVLRQSHHSPLVALATLDEVQYQRRKCQIVNSLKKAIDNRKAQVTVISDEILVSSSYRPYIYTVPVADNTLVAKRLFEIFPEAKILMIIRNQVNFVSSMIAQLMRNNLIKIDHRKFFDLHMKYACEEQGSFFYLVDYNAIYDMYTRIFGKNNIHIMCLENFSKDSEKSMSELSELMGLSNDVFDKKKDLSKRNIRASEFEIFVQKNQSFFATVGRFIPQRFRHFLRKRLADAYSSKPIEVKFNEEQISFLHNFYGPGNFELQKKTNIRLDLLGYPF